MDKIKEDNLFSIIEREDRESEEDWIIHSIIPRSGKVFIYGHGGLGKSRIVYDLVAAVINKLPWLGVHKSIHAYPSLIVAGEGSMIKNRQRLKWACRAHGVRTMNPEDPRCNDLRLIHHTFLLDKSSEAKQFLDCLAPDKISIPQLVVLDPLDSFFIGDENSVKETKLFRHNVDRMVEATKATFVLIHHASKNNGEDKKRIQLRGSTAWFGWADTIIKVDRAEDNLVLTVEKQRNGPSGFSFEVKPLMDDETKVMFFRAVTGPVFEHCNNQIRDASEELQWGQAAAVFQAVLQTPDRSPRSVADMLGINNTNLKKALELLGKAVVQKGKAHKTLNVPFFTPYPLKWFHELMPTQQQLSGADKIDIDIDEPEVEESEVEETVKPN